MFLDKSPHKFSVERIFMRSDNKKEHLIHLIFQVAIFFNHDAKECRHVTSDESSSLTKDITWSTTPLHACIFRHVTVTFTYYNNP